eukprot:2433309-Rhodomonas_salina.4
MCLKPEVGHVVSEVGYELFQAALLPGRDAGSAAPRYALRLWTKPGRLIVYFSTGHCIGNALSRYDMSVIRYLVADSTIARCAMHRIGMSYVSSGELVTHSTIRYQRISVPDIA